MPEKTGFIYQANPDTGLVRVTPVADTPLSRDHILAQLGCETCPRNMAELPHNLEQTKRSTEIDPRLDFTCPGLRLRTFVSANCLND